MEAIRIRSLNKTFRTGLRRKRTHALRGLDLAVLAGEVFGFLGPNGAGKTTAIKILVRLLRPDSGEVSLFGRPPDDRQVRHRIAYLPELPYLYDYLTPGELLIHCGELSGMDRRTLRSRVPALLERVGLNPGERRQLRKFSKGMLQRVGIAQTLLSDPDLFILDEPQGGLDPLGRRWIKDLILELGRAGKTVFFSSHVLSEAEAVCNRVAFLNQGRLLAQGPLGSLLGTQASQSEILVEGSAARDDPQVKSLAASCEASGPDTLVLTCEGAAPNDLLQLLIARGFKIRTVNQRHGTLEQLFIQLVSGDPDRKES